jgi:hypothetical protein
MSHANTEGSNGITPPMSMSVILNQRMAMEMHVLFTIMVVGMHMPAFSDQSRPEHPTEEDKHRANPKLGC